MRDLRVHKRRAVAGIVAAVIFFVMLFTVGTGYFLWINTLNGTYSQAQGNRAQDIQQQQLEDLTLTPSFCSSASTCASVLEGTSCPYSYTDCLAFTVQNVGSIPASIVTNFVDYASSPSCSNQINDVGTTTVGITLNPSVSTTAIDTGCSYTQGTTVTLKVLTQRGNVFSATYPPATPLQFPSISTTLFPGGSIVIGGSAYDVASLSGISDTVGDKVYYNYFGNVLSGVSDGTCSTSLLLPGPGNGGIVTISSSNIVNPSNLVAYPSAGLYSWNAQLYDPTGTVVIASSPCEPLTVGSGSITIATALSPPYVSQFPVTEVDTATVSGTADATGDQVKYSYFSDGTCSGSANVIDIVTVSGTSAPPSSGVNLAAPGPYSFWASLFDSTGSTLLATSPCEPLFALTIPGVTKITPSITTSLYVNGVQGSTAAAGTPVTDYATFPSSDSSLYGGDTALYPTGTLIFAAFDSPSCSGSSVVYVSDNAVVSESSFPATFGPSSPAFYPSVVGAPEYYFQVFYSGDVNNNPVITPCSSEPLTVTKASPSLTTLLSSGGSIYAGGSAVDSATLTKSSGSNAGGTVSYYWFSGGSCGGIAASAGARSVSGGVVPNSDPVTFSAVGSYSWDAVYSGDANNAGATSPCEPMSVSASACIPSPTNYCAATTSQGLGSLSFDFDSFRWYSSGTCAPQGSSPLAVIGETPKSSCTLMGGLSGSFGKDGIKNAPRAYTISQTGLSSTGSSITNLYFSINVTNADSQGRTLAIDQFTQVWFSWFCPEVIGSNGPCAPGPHGQLSATYYGIVMVCAPGTTIWDSNTGDCDPGACLAGAATAGTTCTTTPLITLTGPDISTGAPGQETTIFFGLQDSKSNSLPGIPLCGSVGSVPYSSQVTPSFIFFHGAVGGLTWGVDFPLASTLWTNIGSCGSSASHPTISTTLSSSTTTPGGYVSDTATLSGASSGAGGTITYVYYSGKSCSGASVEVGSPVAVNGNGAYTSSSQQFSILGSYSWQAFYSGDGSNVAATSSCEPMSVGLAPLTISPTQGPSGSTSALTGSGLTHSHLYDDCLSTSGSVACVSGSGSSFTTTSGGATPTPNPTVTVPTGTPPGNYYVIVYSGTTVSALADFTVTTPAITLTPDTGPVGTSVSVAGSGFSANTQITTFTFGGTSLSSCNTGVTTTADGRFTCAFTVPSSSLGSQTVVASGSDVTTIPTDTASTTFDVVQATTTGASCTPNPVAAGSTTTCIGTVSGYTGSIVGDTISFFTSGSGTFTASQCTIATGASCSVTYTPTSAAGSPQTVTAVFGGDSQNGASTGTASLAVTKASPTLSTTVSSSGTISIGGSATDTGTFMNSAGTITGTLVFSAYPSSSCTPGTATFTDNPIAVSGNGPYTSGAFSPASIATNYWQATFTDTDGSNNGFTTACGGTGETLTVSQATPTLTTSATSPIPTGAPSAIDQAILTGAYSPTGTVTFTLYSDSGCTVSVGTASSSSWSGNNGNPWTATGTVTHAFNTAGTYYWLASFAGDSNNVASGPTACSAEPLVVHPAPTVTVSPATIDSGQTATLAAIASGGSGTYTNYAWYLGTSCTGTALQSGTSTTYTTAVLTATTTYCAAVTDSLGDTGTTTVAVTVNAVLSVSAPAVAIDSGQTATLTAIASGGSGTYSTYAWYSGSSCTGTPKQSGSSNSYTTAVLTSATTYCVKVTDSLGGTATTTVTVTVNADPTVTVTPSGTQTRDQSQSAQQLTATITYSGTNTASVEWYSSTTTCNYLSSDTGQAGTTYTPSTSSTGTTYYCAVVSDSGVPGYSSPSNAVRVIVNTALVAPTVSSSPGTVYQGGSSSLTSTSVTTGSSPYTYQWYGEAPGAGSFSSISGATSSSYTFSTTGSTTTGTWSFELKVTDSAGAIVTSNTATVVVTPSLTISPTSCAHGSGGSGGCNHAGGLAITLTGSGFADNTVYDYCLSSSSTSVSCLAGSGDSFQSTLSGAIPSSAATISTNGLAGPATDYVIVYNPSTHVIYVYATFTVT